MNKLSISFEDGKSSYLPGEIVRGRGEWFLQEAPKELEVTLFWYTSGKGTEDVEVVDSLSHPNPGAHGEMPFSFQLPKEPYSFSGTYITLSWAVELLVHDPDDSHTEEIILSPTLNEILLHEVPKF